MDIFSSLNVGVTGLQAQSDAINTISQNISNANTVGYKEGVTSFAALITDNSANNYSVNGGGSPDAALSFSGVAASDIQLNDVQGVIAGSNSPTDLAISGDGFFAVSSMATGGASNLEYTRAGSFTPDKNSNYANAAGAFLQAWALGTDGTLSAGLSGTDVASGTAIGALQTVNVQNLIPTPVPTTTVSLEANLDALQAAYDGPLVYDPTNSAANMADGAITPDFTIPVTVVDSTGVDHTLDVGFLKGPTLLTDSGTGPFSNVSSDGTSMTVTGTVPDNLAVGDTVAFIGSGPILDSNGNTILNADEINTTHTVLSVGTGSYTVSITPNPAGIQATGDIAFTANPSNGDSITLNGQAWTFVTSGAVGNETNIGASLSDTLAQLASDLTAAGAAGNVSLAAATYGVSSASPASTELNITSNTFGAGGATYTLASTQPNGTPSGLTLAGPGGVQAAGDIDFSISGNPNPGDTITLNGVSWEFVAGGATGNETNIGASLDATLAQLVTDLSASGNPAITSATYGVSPASPASTQLTITDNAYGVSGNGYTLAASAATPSGLTLTGGVTTTNTGALSTDGMASGAGAIDQVTPNTWAVEIYANPASDVTAIPNGQVAAGTVSFNGDGTLASVSTTLTQAIPITWTGVGVAASSIDFSWGTAGAIGIGQANGLGQFAAAYNILGVQQNGIQANTSTTVSISATGIISVTYSNGSARNLYQIPLAQFTNPEQLQSLSGNVFTPTVGSGTLTFFTPGDNAQAVLAPEALEDSNVDLSTQLTNMIIAQNAYQANTKLISTSDQMMQTAVQMDQSISI